jgi:hypothetical protein
LDISYHFHKIYISPKHTINSSSHTEDIYPSLEKKRKEKKRKEMPRKTFPFVFLAESD